MSARDAILGRIRRQLEGKGGADREKAVATRLSRHPKGLIPERGQIDAKARVKLFAEKVLGVQASVKEVANAADIPKAVAAYLRDKNLPAEIRMGSDRRLTRLPWKAQKSLTVKRGASDGEDMTGISHALAGVAETGTLLLTSGMDNPTTINFLPEHHIVVINAADIDGDMEAAMARLRKKAGKGEMPRAVNLVTGPSRSGDVEQKIILGAHGPRALHVIIAGKAK